MSNNLFPHLLAPLQIGGVTVKNRIFSSGHDTVMVHDGTVTDQLVEYHRARAIGGAGLIIMQVAGIHETAHYTSHVLMATDDSCIEGYRRVADAVHPHGCALFGQVFHPGREIMESQDGALPVAYAPSAVPNERFRVMPRPMSSAMIAEVIAGYAAGARRLQQAGLDGVEIVASHGYLPAQFLSPTVNLRTDAYGGDLDGRMRFLREAIAAVRAAVGPDFAVGVRLSSTDHNFAEEDVTDVVEVCRCLDDDGLLDYIGITEGSSASIGGSMHIVPPMSEAAAYTAAGAAAVTAAVSIPVLVAGRINQPQEAEIVIAAGQADACAMTRALICDPDMPTKAAAERPDDIRACIGCNQACIGHFQSGYPISCIQRPETGREREFGTLTITPKPKDVMVVGGGPAGMKAASVAAQRGHRVTLFEASGRVGGQIRLAELLPGRSEFGGASTNLQAELDRYGVIVKTHVEVDAAMIGAQRPDHVIVATGATPYRPPLELDGDLPVFEAWDVIRDNGANTPKGELVVADWRCDWTGLGVAEMLARPGRRVTLCVNGFAAGENLQRFTRISMLRAAADAKVKIVPTARLFGADDDTVYLVDTVTGEPIILDGVAGLVLALGQQQNDGLLCELDAAGIPYTAVGDCLAPRTVEEAVLDGLKAGHAI
ncbi:oxidoreductase [Gordonia rhizosphera]|uniref:Putative NADH-dependent oxidoreductase n=1 Tax=Gordonia rhizosphera NBRC 16068 TaxID=1108045 RepID=K6WDA3_9ACTN|nr:FAD-dependent oxidoreductase [Gordonia rhizosphera]GAB90167.1 putative NADH-dependent oxidoreductase [Gordonia rhizosphera NBRC 16068]